MVSNQQLPKAPITWFLDVFLVNSDFYTMWLSIDIFQVLMLCAVFIVSTCLYWMLCPTFFINVFYLVLFCIHVCVDAFMENKQTNKKTDLSLFSKIASQNN